jgi:mRNA interferase RelE/StbE
MFKVLYVKEVVNEGLPSMLEPWKSDIKKAIESKLMTRPEVYSRPLRRSLKGYRKLKVGEYRVILRIEEETIMIFAIQHRSKVYDSANKRL